jgi:ligand-binding sensor domain-containing protein/signal transduction histidine kinase
MNSKKLTPFALTLLLLPTACTNDEETKAFPANESEFVQPATTPFTFSKPHAFDWSYASLDTLVFSELKFNLASIPSLPFKNGGFQSMSKPPDTVSLDYGNAPSAPLDLDTLTAYPLRSRTYLLGKPKRTKAGFPRLKDSAKQDILIFSQDQGLPGNVGFRMCQSKGGWLWIGTDNGLCRFDGEYCETYTTEQGLSANNVVFMTEDREGRLWLQNQKGGVDVLDLVEGTLTRFTGPKGFNEDLAQYILVDSQNQVWIGTAKNGVYLVDGRRKTVKNISTSQGLNDYEILSLLESRDGTILIGTYRGLNILDQDKHQIRYPTADLGRQQIRGLAQDGTGKIWMTAYEDGVYVLDQPRNRITRLTQENGLSSNRVLDILCDSKGQAWIGTSIDGVNVVDLTQGTLRIITEAEGLSNNSIWNIIEDSQQQVWIGATAGGVNRIDLNGGELKHLTPLEGLSSSNMKGFCLDKQDNVWLASIPGGIDVIGPHAQTVKHLSGYLKLPISDGCWDIIQDNEGRIWAGTNNGIFIIDTKKGTVRHLLDGLNVPSVNGLFLDKTGNVWAATQGGGLVVIDLKNNSLRYLTESNGLSQNFPGNFWQAPTGEVWIGTEGGGISIVDETRKTILYLSKDEGLPNPFVRAMTADAQQRLWVATYGGGIALLDLPKQRLTNFTPANGLGDLTVVSLKPWQGIMYAGTGKGLTQITEVPNPKGVSTWQLKNLTRQQGFLNSDFNTNAFLITPQGKFWLGASDVLTLMQRASPPTDSITRPIPYFTSLDIMDVPQDFRGKQSVTQTLERRDTLWESSENTFFTKTQLPTDTSTLRRSAIRWDSLSGTWHLPVGLTLPHDQNHLTFHFTGTHLSHPDKTRYRYMLEGNDSQWNPITSEPSADYRNLSPGTYVFRLSSEGFDGAWSAPIAFSFRVRPPWWLTWWAYLLYAILGFLLVRETIRIRTRKLSEQKKLLEETVAVRTGELRATTHELSVSLEELKTTQEELVRQEKLASIGQLTKGIVDRILNPLNYINNFSESSVSLMDEIEVVVEKNKEVFSEDDRDEVEYSIPMLKKSLSKINEHGNSTARIVGDMQKLLKKRSTKFVETELNQYLQVRVPALIAESIKKENTDLEIAITFDFSPEPATVLLLPDEFEQALRNIIHNACYALIEKHKLRKDFKAYITVGTRLNAEMVEILLRDNGKGIVKKELEQICSPFFTTKPTAQGTGLGLFMTKDIIEDHKGTLDVASVEGEFTELTIALPLSKPDNA